MRAGANIRCVLTDALGWPPGDFGAFQRGEKVFEDGWRPLGPCHSSMPGSIINSALIPKTARACRSDDVGEGTQFRSSPA